MSLAGCLGRLDDAIDAASALGLDATAAQGVRDTARARLGFPGDVYVLALAGGTGVGKSSLLNALAGSKVSPAAARRPTTSEPVAWVPRASRAELAPLLDWLAVKQVREHGDERARGVAILDLPDIDSTAPEHRARVDELLPRVDAVMWVTDPEKYQDAVLHDDYLRRWIPRLGRQLIVLNKMDRVDAGDGNRLRDDLAARLRAHGLPEVQIALASAAEGEHGVLEVRRWIEGAADAKRVVAARLASDARAASTELAERSGVSMNDGPLVTPERRSRVLGDVMREMLAILDLRGFERQAVAATRLAARPRGAGPMGHVTSFIYRASGRKRVAADPAAFLRRWPERGTLARPAEPLRALLVEILATLPPGARPPMAALADAAAVQARIRNAVDPAIASVESGMTVPRSPVWSVLGLFQYAVTGILLFTGLWFALLLFAPVTVGVVVLPAIGPVPVPLVLLAATLLVGYVLARILGAHAGWLGRRWAARMSRALAGDVAGRLGTDLFAPIVAVDAARDRLRTAWRGAESSCGGAAAEGGEAEGTGGVGRGAGREVGEVSRRA